MLVKGDTDLPLPKVPFDLMVMLAGQVVLKKATVHSSNSSFQ